MADVKRYDIFEHSHDVQFLRESSDGDYVKFADYDAQSLELQAVREALGEYGEHKTTCTAHPYVPDGPWGSRLPCSCGFDAALKQSRGA